MKFSIHQPALFEIIQTVSKSAAMKTPKQALSGILLEVSLNQLTATAYDLEQGIQRFSTVNDDNDLDIIETGSIVLPARYFTEVVRKLPDSKITIQVQNNYMTAIESGSASFHLHGIDAEEFPKLPTFQRSRSIRMKSGDLSNLIKSTSFATSTSEVRPVLTAVHVTCNGKVLDFLATDAHRLARKHAPIEIFDEPDSWSANIPAKCVTELVKLLQEHNQTTIQFTESHCLFEIGSTLFYSRLVDGEYPDTSRIIPDGQRTLVKFDVESLMGAIDRAALIARDREVRLEVNDEGATITSNSPEIGNLSERIEMISKEGDSLTISFTAKYVLDALRAMDGPVVHIHFNGWNQPFVLRQENDAYGLQLISPVLMR